MGWLGVATRRRLSASLFACAGVRRRHHTYGTATHGSGAGLGLSADAARPRVLAAAVADRARRRPRLAAPTAPARAPPTTQRRLPLRQLPQARPRARSRSRDGKLAQGSDLAFRGNLHDRRRLRGRRLVPHRRGSLASSPSTTAPARRATSRFSATTLFVSVDTPSSNSEQSRDLQQHADQRPATSLGKEGLRIVDISDPRNPRQVGFVETECGSHTHTLIPGEQRSTSTSTPIR